MVNGRAVVVEMVGRGPEWAGPVRHFLEIVLRVGRALHVVERAARRARRRRGLDAGDFGVGFDVHCHPH